MIEERVTALEAEMDNVSPGWRDIEPDVTVITGLMPGGFVVPAGETWEVRGIVETDGNVIAEGTLRMRGSGDVGNPTTLRFIDVDEAAMVGGGMDVVDSDVGLWVMGDGVLDIQGTPKAAWNRTGSDPSWQASDELILCPTHRAKAMEQIQAENPDLDIDTRAGRRALKDLQIEQEFLAYENFLPFTMGSPVPTVGPYSAEVMNLSRDVAIEGTLGGRAHILIRSTKPQTVKHCLLQHLAPRGLDDNGVILGRWGLHFHHSGDGARGSVVEGVVARKMGAHAFVFHSSHGIMAHELIAFDCLQSPFWWDRGDETNDLLYDRCVAAKIDHGAGGYEKHSGGGVVLGSGTGSILRDFVAVGVLLRSGIDWRDRAAHSPWTLEGTNVSHNNHRAARVWHNSHRFRHDAGGMVFYRNDSGLLAGAYGTPLWHYENIHFLESGGISAKARAKDDPAPDRPDGYGMSFENIVIEGHPGPWLRSPGRPKDASAAMLVKDIEIVNGSMEVLIDEDGGFGLYDLVNVVNAGVSLEPGDVTILQAPPRFLLRCQRPDGTAWKIDGAGVVSEDIAPFYQEVT